MVAPCAGGGRLSFAAHLLFLPIGPANDQPGGNEAIVPTAARLVFDVAGAAEALGVSQASVYAAVKSKTLPSFRLGRRVLIPKAALEALLDRASASGANPAA